MISENSMEKLNTFEEKFFYIKKFLILSGLVQKNKFKKFKRNKTQVSIDYEIGGWKNFLDSKCWENFDSIQEFVNPKSKGGMEDYRYIGLPTKFLAIIDNKLCKVSQPYHYDYRLKLYLKHLTKNLRNDETVVEMGCGPGFNLWSLLSINFPNPLEGHELSKNAIFAANQIKNKYHCDIKLGNTDLTDFKTFPNLIDKTIFTNHVIEQLKYDTTKVLENLIKAKPKQVMHFEPVLELYGNKLADKAFRKYISGLDYQRSLLSTLQKFENDGLIKILESKRLGFASNPLLETCFIRWEIN